MPFSTSGRQGLARCAKDESHPLACPYRSGKLGWRIPATVYGVVIAGLIVLNLLIINLTTENFLGSSSR
jgi:hypothetical protein